MAKRALLSNSRGGPSIPLRGLWERPLIIDKGDAAYTSTSSEAHALFRRLSQTATVQGERLSLMQGEWR